MRTIAAAVAEAAAALTEAGFSSVSDDPAALTVAPDAVWLEPRQIIDRTLDGGGTLVLDVHLIAANVDDAPRLLDDALARVLALYGTSDADDPIDLKAAVLLPSAPQTVLPGYRVAVDLDL